MSWRHTAAEGAARLLAAILAAPGRNFGDHVARRLYERRILAGDPEKLWRLEPSWVEAFSTHPDALADYIAARDATGMAPTDHLSKRGRFLALHAVADFIAQQPGLDGDVAECGCWRGHSAYMLATVLERRGFRGRFHIFDSFEGLSEPKDEDFPAGADRSPSSVKKLKETFAADESLVRENLSRFSMFDFYKGWIPERFAEVADRRFVLVNIDVDLIDPILQSLHFFYPRLAEGGAITLDDYGMTQFPGARAAVDRFLADHRPRGFLPVPTGGAVILK